MLGVVWLVQRRVARGGTKNGLVTKERARESVHVVAKRGIGAKAQLVVVDVDDVRYVLGVTDGGITVIDQTASGAADAVETSARVAPLTALPQRVPATRSEAKLARARSTSLAGFLQKDAARVLRRAIGA